MNFDVGNILSRSAQISWRHKSIWGLLLLPMPVAFLPFVPIFVLLISLILLAETDTPRGVYIVLGFALLVLFALSVALNYMVGCLSLSAATLGVIRAEKGEGSTRFMDLLRDGTRYFGRILGVMLIINLTFFLVYAAFSLIGLVLILVTFGLASICMQPVMILLTPLMFLVIGFQEAAQVSVIAGDMNVMDAVKHALSLVRVHVWKFIIITLLVYFGSSILSSIIMMPLMLPIFALPILVEFTQDVSVFSVMLVSVLFMGIFLPIMILVSSVLGVFMKTSLDLTCLHLTQNRENQVLFSQPQP